MNHQLKTVTSAGASSKARHKSIGDLVDNWLAERSMCDRLVSQWQSLEHRLSLKAKTKKIGLERALCQPWPETKAMGDLMRRITAFDRRLPKSADTIMSRDSSSRGEAIAKLRLGLAMRSRSPDDDDAWAMIEKAHQELCRLDCSRRED